MTIMRAALLEQQGLPLTLADDVVIEAPRPGEVLVRVAYCGVCHSDLHIIDGSVPAITPVILGHEASGIVEATGDGVTTLTKGDRVVLTACPPCGRCYFCVRGQAVLCGNAAAVATSTFPDGSTRLSRGGATVYRGVGVGAFSEYAITLESGAVRIPDEVPLEVAAVLGCAVQTGVGAVLNTARVEEGATVLIIGLGGIGLAMVQGARIAGAPRIIVSDPVATRREAALRFGATDAIDPTREDVASRTLELTGVGADYAFEAVGRARLIETALGAVRPGGTAVCVGAPPLDEAIQITPAVVFVASEKTLKGCLLGSANSHREIPRLLSLWHAGRLDLEGLVTATRPLAEINAAFDDLRAARGIRTMLRL